jgi:hypothetical protein
LSKAPSGQQVVLSESRLLPLLADVRTCLTDPRQALQDPCVLPASAVAPLVAQWQAQVAAGGKALVKTTRGVLEEMSSGSLYEHLDAPRWKTAALVCEVFRSPDISKNAGWLATRQLQGRIAAALEGSGPLEFSIAWGQAKRDVGGLKALGPLPDLAEFHALARLSMVADAIARHLDGRQEVRLRILGGAVRFSEAFFTREDLAHAYDRQRAHIAALLVERPAITVEPFVPPAANDDARDADGDGIEDHDIVAHFPTIALNVDWGRFFRPTPPPDAAPHPRLPALPAAVAHWLAGHDDAQAARLLRAAVTCTLNPRCRIAWEEHFPGSEGEVLDAAAEFVHGTAWQSTRQYLRVQARVRASETGSSPGIRLTVHEKRSRGDIPAVYTLGPQGGDQLPQHVVARLGPQGTLRFGPVAEFLQSGPLRPVLIGMPAAGAAPPPIDWLAGSAQPLCLAAANAAPVEDLLAKALRL